MESKREGIKKERKKERKSEVDRGRSWAGEKRGKVLRKKDER